jgi:hypothetical protein
MGDDCPHLYVVLPVRKLGKFRYILIPEIINMFMTNMSDPVRAKNVLVFVQVKSQIKLEQNYTEKV